MVNKRHRLNDEHGADLTPGGHAHHRAIGYFSITTGDNAGRRRPTPADAG